MRVFFGDLTLDLGSRELLRKDAPVHLSPKAFHLLEILVAAEPKAMSKADLHDRLWPETFVSDSNLPGLVAEVRAAIGDDSREPRFLRTVQRFGYAFSGVMRRPDLAQTAKEYRLIHGSREIALQAGENILGRDHEAVAWIEGKTVSRHHARITVSNEGAIIEDLGSKNGTFVAGQRVVAPVVLSDGVRVALGRTLMTFRVFRAAASTETVEAR